MSEQPGYSQKQRGEKLGKAVHKSKTLSRSGLGERAFTMLFKGLVYPQIWEDPVVDMEALDIQPDSHVMTIASGGCNVLSYLTANPRKITAVDLNTAHVALTRLKLCAAINLPDYETFFRFFGRADDPRNVDAYNTYIKPHLDLESRKYWEQRTISGRRRIALFKRNLYRSGLLGKFIGAGHLFARLYGRDLKKMTDMATLEEQRTYFDREIAPLFDKRFVRWLVSKPSSLYGLGIPPAQYTELAASGDGNMALVLRQRLEKLTCDFPLNENYFAQQAYGRRYGEMEKAELPPYLKEENYQAVHERAPRVEMRHSSYTDFLNERDDKSLDRFILLDAQDWMNDEDLTELWREITRVSRKGARVIFRTAAEKRLLPGRIPDELLDQWEYDEELCADLTRRDRSAIYGAVHLYVLKD